MGSSCPINHDLPLLQLVDFLHNVLGVLPSQRNIPRAVNM